MATQRYRTVGYSASVDESLFGERTSQMLKNSRKVVTGPPVPSATILSQTELLRIKNESVIKTEAELIAERERAQSAKEDRERQARERKDRMKQLEKQATLKAKLSDEEVAQIARDQAIRAGAKVMADNASDVVKVLTSMSARAAAFTLREKQLEEKKQREQLEREYERRMDIVMEVDRIKELQRREDEEREKRLKRVEDRKVITDQMEQRQRMKYLAAEMREQENQAMRMTMKKYSDEDAAVAARRKQEIEKSRQEVLVANELAISRKKEAKYLEKKEMEDILIYQAMKDRELAAREEEERIVERSKKERQAKLLDQQERAQNNADKIDEIRARRAAEERERRARLREKEEKAKRKADMDELLESRAVQAEDKKRRQDATKRAQLAEFETTLQHMQTMAQREVEEAQRKKEMSDKHRTSLMSQIESAERRRLENRTDKMAEGTQLRHQYLQEEARYGVIRDTMVHDLEDKGVNPRFLTEMRAVDVGKILKKFR